ncbi:sensor histidine kinase [Geobacillus sp. PK12]|uniref:YpdA n=1 Tax=Geobacillus thermodenitrificans TaxID=33940 RepID=A0A291I5R5_GEOTD|nr:sensor histidine kinase [Geobacillus sp. PK12]ATG84596.1 YpdA [Geobacillus thermodenitrificans]RXS90456.1 sensor histidine kinase [Geobacillus sp. PK12]
MQLYFKGIARFRNFKLRNKLIIAFIIVVFIPVMIVGMFLTYELRKSAIDQAVVQSKGNIERVKKRIVEVLRTPVYILNTLQFDDRLKDLVNRSYETTYQVVKAYQEYRDFKYYLQYYNSEISNIRFYIDNPSMLNNWSFIPTSDGIKQSTWYQQAEKQRGLTHWFYIPDETKGNRWYLSLVKRIDFPDYKTYGILVITVNPAQLQWIIEQEPYLTMIVDENNRIVAANQNEIIGQNLSTLIQWSPSFNDVPLVKEGIVAGKRSQVIIDTLLPNTSLKHLKVVSVVSNSDILQGAKRLSIMGGIIVLIGMGIALVLTIWFSWLLTKRLSIVTRQMKHVTAGNLNTMVEVDGEDEIGQLSEQFNHMVCNLRRLIEETQRANEEKNRLAKRQSEIKFKMLASQINPHFLFNTLEAIRMKAYLKGEKEIAYIVKVLGKLIRRSIEVEGKSIPLKDELENVKWYLEIQKFRYSDRLSYRLDVDSQAENILVPPMIIQPLVENAVIHGLENKGSGGEVIVKAEIYEQKELHISVVDNGVGIEETKLREIYGSLEDQTESQLNRIGLCNVHQRLQLAYGKRSGLQIESKKGEGTVVRFAIPMGSETNV